MQAELDFGTVPRGQAKRMQFHLVNDGELPAPFSIANSSRRFVAVPDHGEVASGERAAVEVSFEPFGVEAETATLAIASPAGGPSPSLSVSLVGRGGVAEIEVLCDLLDFGSVLRGSDATVVLKVINNGAADGIFCFGDLLDRVPALSFPQRLSANDYFCVPPKSMFPLQIAFSPTSLAPLAEEMQISFLGSSKTFLVRLVGSVGEPSISVSPEPVLVNMDFGLCAIGVPNALKVHFTNTGSIPLELEASLVTLRPAPRQAHDEHSQLAPDEERSAEGHDELEFPSASALAAAAAQGTRVNQNYGNPFLTELCSPDTFFVSPADASRAVNFMSALFERYKDRLIPWPPSTSALPPADAALTSTAKKRTTGKDAEIEKNSTPEETRAPEELALSPARASILPGQVSVGSSV
jgi:hypothetical protein